MNRSTLLSLPLMTISIIESSGTAKIACFTVSSSTFISSREDNMAIFTGLLEFVSLEFALFIALIHPSMNFKIK